MQIESKQPFGSAQGKSNTPLKGKVFIGMSGGVDSSVTALLLKKKGYDVVGVFIRSYNIDGCAETDAEDARRVAGKLGIPFYVWDFEKEYKKKVVDYMVDGYRRGLTPNPDVMCNKEIKFGLFLEKALSMGADYVATGHYVRLCSSANSESSTNKRIKKTFVNSKNIRYSLMAARDAQKDQSYFLWTLTQKQLGHCLFPIGDYLKSEVRAIAKKAGLPTADKKDSQGICFLGKVTLADFLSNYLPAKRGVVLNTAGKAIGEHSGAQFYTIGQRHIGISNIKYKKSNNEPFYVAEKNVKTNTLVVAEGNDNPALYKKEIKLADVNFINPLAISHKPLAVFARVRYRQPLANATLIFADGTPINADKKYKNLRKSASKSAKIRVLFRQGQKFVAPGQSTVFYMRHAARDMRHDKYEMLGGGIIR